MKKLVTFFIVVLTISVFCACGSGVEKPQTAAERAAEEYQAASDALTRAKQHSMDAQERYYEVMDLINKLKRSYGN